MVDQVSGLFLTFGLVHGGISGGVDDHVRRDASDRFSQPVECRQVSAEAGFIDVPAQRHNLAQRRQRTLQLPTHLTVLTQEQYFHSSRP